MFAKGQLFGLLLACHVCLEGNIGVTRESHGQPFQMHLLFTASSDWSVREIWFPLPCGTEERSGGKEG